MTNYLSALLGYRTVLDSDGDPLTERRAIRFTGFSVVDNPVLECTDVSLIPPVVSSASVLAALAAAAGPISVNGQRIVDVGAPTPGSTDAATAAYVESLVADAAASFASYADAGDAATLAAANSYTDDARQSAEDYADTGDSTTLASAKAYADSLTAGLHREIFTASGTWTCPSGVTTALVIYWGGSGQGGGGRRPSTTGTPGAGGGAGGAARKCISIIHPTPTEDYTITIGAKGTGAGKGGSSNGSNGAAGNDGGDTTITGLGVDLVGKGAKGGLGGGSSNVRYYGGSTSTDIATPTADLDSTTLLIWSRPGHGGYGGPATATQTAGGDGFAQEFAGGAGGAAGTDSTNSGASGGGGGGGGPGGPGGAGGKGGNGVASGTAGAGAAGTAPAANSGAGGGGGGGGGSGPTSGNGGEGAEGSDGYVEILY